MEANELIYTGWMAMFEPTEEEDKV